MCQALPVASSSERGRSFGVRPWHSPVSARIGDGTRATGESQFERAGTDHGHARPMPRPWTPT
jgi:hypothetical protein